MSRYFDELERRLRDATSERHGTGSPPRSSAHRADWARRHRRLLVFAVVALTGLAVPAVGAVTDLWRPDVRPPPPMGTVRSSPGTAVSCRHTSAPPLDVGPPVGRAFTSVLGVLARPRTAADAIERRYLSGPGLVGVDVDGVRYLGTAPDGVRYFVVPVRGYGRHSIPERCLRKLSPKARRLFSSRPQPREPMVCVYGGGGGGCSTIADVSAHGSYGSSGTLRSRSTVAGVVPNGVDDVRVTYGTSTRTFPVRENFFAFRVALGAPQAVKPDRVEWLMDDGSVRDVTRRPPPRTDAP